MSLIRLLKASAPGAAGSAVWGHTAGALVHGSHDGLSAIMSRLLSHQLPPFQSLFRRPSVVDIIHLY
jgi:hypothetical protein